MNRLVVVLSVSLAMVACGSPKAADWNAVIAEVQSQYQGVVVGGRYEDDFLVINVTDGTSKAGASLLACETVKPVLKSHGVEGQQFAIYRPDGQVLATGSGCP